MGTWENKVQIHMDQDFCPALQAHLKVLTLTVLVGQFPLEQFMSQHPHLVWRLFTSPWKHRRMGFLFLPLWLLVETSHCSEVFSSYCSFANLVAQSSEVCSSEDLLAASFGSEESQGKQRGGPWYLQLALPFTFTQTPSFWQGFGSHGSCR